MQVITYTGNGTSQFIYVGFKTDFFWFKSRSTTGDNKLVDTVRGISQGLISNTISAETTDYNGILSVTDVGFNIGSNSAYNSNGVTYVVWCWKAGGTAFTNTEGSIQSVVSANKSAGFSIVTYTGTGVNANIGHGLDDAPKFIIIKNRLTAQSGFVYHYEIGPNNYMILDATNAASASSTAFNNTAANTKVFSVGTSTIGNQNLAGQVAYCWAEIPGYSKFGKYVGNGEVNGIFVHLGFSPKFILIKRSSDATNWRILDTTRDPFNVVSKEIYPNLSSAEANFVTLDVVSNGFKIRNNDAAYNTAGGTYVYAAFAENPFQNANAR